jgi:hypothetical protein
MPLVSATLTTHFLFIPSSNSSFLFASDFYKYILPTLQIFEFNEEEQEGQFLQKKNSKILWLPQKNCMALSNVPGKLSFVNQIQKF